MVSGVEGDGPSAPSSTAHDACSTSMVASPRAAVALEAGPRPDSSTAAATRSSSTCRPWRVRAYHWKGYYEPAGEATEVLAGERVEAGPGWTLDLPALDPPPGDDITTHVTVDLAIVSGDNVVPVQVQHLPEIPEPHD